MGTVLQRYLQNIVKMETKLKIQAFLWNSCYKQINKT